VVDKPQFGENRRTSEAANCNRRLDSTNSRLVQRRPLRMFFYAIFTGGFTYSINKLGSRIPQIGEVARH
jgi:hypothetical protein